MQSLFPDVKDSFKNFSLQSFFSFNGPFSIISEIQSNNEKVMRKAFLIAPLLAAASIAFAAPTDTDRVKVLVKQKMNIEATSAKRLPMGLYEVVADRNLLYVDKDVKFLFAGHIYDIANQKDLTQARLDDLSKIDIKGLPLNQAIKTVHGKGERNLYVFADPYCSFCQRLEHTLKDLDNVTIYTFITPLMNSAAMVDRIHCAANPEKAWSDWMLEQKEPPELPKNCKTDTGNKNMILFNRFGLEGLPTMYFDDGYRLEGAVSLEEIEKRFKELK